MEAVTTERLLVRRATPADAPFFLALLNSPGWLTYIGDRGVGNLAAARRYVREKILPAYATPGLGSYVVVPRGADAPVGFVGVFRRPELDAPDFGFAFLPEGQGRGYAHEASVAVLARPQVRRLPRLLAITLPNNLPSQRLLERLGFRYREDLLQGDPPETLWRYELER